MLLHYTMIYYITSCNILTRNITYYAQAFKSLAQIVTTAKCATRPSSHGSPVLPTARSPRNWCLGGGV